jgi:hypothetical protein
MVLAYAIVQHKQQKFDAALPRATNNAAAEFKSNF